VAPPKALKPPAPTAPLHHLPHPLATHWGNATCGNQRAPTPISRLDCLPQLEHGQWAIMVEWGDALVSGGGGGRRGIESANS